MGMLERLYRWLTRHDRLKIELDMLGRRGDALESLVKQLSDRVAVLETAARMVATPPGLINPRPRYTPEDLPPDVAKLVDWERLGMEAPED
jgi:hypothetical protein